MDLFYITSIYIEFNDAVLLQWLLASVSKEVEILIEFMFRLEKRLKLYSMSQKSPPLRGPDIFSFLSQTVESFWLIFTHLSTLACKFLFNYSWFWRSYAILSATTQCPPSAKTHAFRRLRKSLIALLIVVCVKSLQNKHFYNVNKHVGYDMTSTMTSFAQ